MPACKLQEGIWNNAQHVTTNSHWRSQMNPHASTLSVGGAWEVKRHFTLPAMTHERDAQVVTARLGRLPGVRGAKADLGHHRVTVVYDITRLYYRQVLDTLAETGFPVPETWWLHLKSNWLQGLDETGRENANTPAAPCCSNPTCLTSAKKSCQRPQA